MKSLVSRVVKDESGATAIEYGLIAALVSVTIVGVLALMRSQLEALYAGITEAVLKASL